MVVNQAEKFICEYHSEAKKNTGMAKKPLKKTFRIFKRNMFCR